MRGLTASDLLSLYERGRHAGAAERALLMLEASDGADREALARSSVGRRNALLLQLREATFGHDLECVATCPTCGERLEISFIVGDVANAGAHDQTDEGTPPTDWRVLVDNGRKIRYRLPTTADLAAIEALPDQDAARRALIERCVAVTEGVGRGRSAARLSAGLIARIGEEIAAADPHAVVDLQSECPSCDRPVTVAFDIAAFLWDEIAARAPRLLLEIHELATAYGWRESDIMALTPWRRHAYLSMLGT